MAQKVLADLSLHISANSADLKKELDKAKNQLRGFEKKTQKSKGIFSQAFSNMKSSVMSIGPAIAGAFAIGAIVNAGKKVFELSQKVGDATQKIKSLGTVSDDSLTKVTGMALGMSDVYNKEFDEIYESAKVLSNEMGISFQQALQLIDDGFASGADVRGEFLEQIKEYSTQFDSAGYSAEEFISIIAQSEKMGVFSDKAIDSIKEATIRLREMPQSTKDALETIGISGEAMQRGLNNGSISIKDAINTISEEISKLPENSQQVGQAIADIFGSAGEDAGYNFVSGIYQMDTELDNLKTKSGELDQELVKSSAKINEVWSRMFGESSIGWKKIKVAVKDVVSDGLATLFNKLIDVRTNAKLLWEVMKSGIQQSIEMLKNIGRTLGYIFNPKNWGAGFKDGLKEILESGGEEMNKMKEELSNKLSEIVEDGESRKIKIGVELDEEQTKNEVRTSVNNIQSIYKDEIDKLEPIDVGKTLKFDTVKPEILDVSGSLSDVNKLTKEWNELNNTVDNTTTMVTDIDGAFSDMGQEIGGMLADGERDFRSYARVVLDSIMSILSGLLAEWIIGLYANEGAKEGVYGLAIATLASAGAYAIYDSVIGAIDFADGGVVYGETLARVAEYPNAKQNPEVIAPLSKLENILSSSGDGKVELIIEGDTIKGVLDKNFIKNNIF